MHHRDSDRLRQFGIRLMKVSRPYCETIEGKRVAAQLVGALATIVNDIENATKSDEPIPPTLRPGA